MMTSSQYFIGFVFLMCLTLTYKSFAQLRSYEFEDLDSLQKVEPRNVLIFIHTDWCKYCQMMKNTTLKSKEVIDTLNNKYYYISLHGEERRDIVLLGKVFKYTPTGMQTGIHQLTKELASIDKNISYPSICILNPQYEIIFQRNEYIVTKEFQAILSESANH